MYYDRARGTFEAETVYARGFLRWLYNSRPGGLVEQLLVGTPLPSRAWAAFHRSRWSRRRIRGFVDRMGIDMSESARGVDDFGSFHEFFVRSLRAGSRPITADPEVCVAPVDGKVLAYPCVEPDRSFRVKRASFRLGALLRDPELAATFAGGSMAVCRLGLSDYHHFHFPDSGTPGPSRTIPGRYHAGGPYAERTLVPFFAENRRMVTVLESDHFGRVGMVEVGALTVGSIQQRFRPGARVVKGEAKGFFELGGSTVVLLFGPGAIALDPELCDLTARDVESFVRMGRPLGTRAAP